MSKKFIKVFEKVTYPKVTYSDADVEATQADFYVYKEFNTWYDVHGNADKVQWIRTNSLGDEIIQESTIVREYDEHGNETHRSVDDICVDWTYEYDENGNLLSEVGILKSGHFMPVHTERKYDTNNHLIYEKHNGEETYWKYDENGHCIYYKSGSTELFNRCGIHSGKVLESFNKDGRMIQRFTHNNMHRRVVSVTGYGGSSGHDRHFKQWKYNNRGDILEYRYSGDLICSWEYEYDSSGNILTMTVNRKMLGERMMIFNPNDGSFSYEPLPLSGTYYYKYDENNNMIYMKEPIGSEHFMEYKEV